jgi:hypothetical protein
MIFIGKKFANRLNDVSVSGYREFGCVPILVISDRISYSVTCGAAYSKFISYSSFLILFNLKSGLLIFKCYG